MKSEEELVKVNPILTKTSLQKNDVRIRIKTGNGHILIPVSDIYYCQADGSSSKIIRIGKTVLSFPKVLKELEKKLINFNFVRCHRSYLVNTLYIKEINGCRNKTILLTNNDKIPCSREKYKKVLTIFDE